MTQLTFKLEYWTDGITMGEDGYTVACPDFQKQIAKKLKENPSYEYSQFFEVPNRAVNVKQGILILRSKEPSEDFEEKRNQIIAMLYQCMDDQHDAKETLKLIYELVELK